MSMNTSDEDLADRLGPVVMTMRVIVVTLAAGVLGFAVVAVVMGPADAQQQAAAEIGVLTIMAIGAAPIAVVLSRVVPAVMVKNSRGQIANGTYGSFPGPTAAGRQPVAGVPEEIAPYCALYQTKTIVGAALLEGAAFMAVTAFLLEGNRIALGLAVCLAALILVMLPSASRVADWIRQQQRLLEDEQRLAR